MRADTTTCTYRNHGGLGLGVPECTGIATHELMKAYTQKNGLRRGWLDFSNPRDAERSMDFGRRLRLCTPHLVAQLGIREH